MFQLRSGSLPMLSICVLSALGVSGCASSQTSGSYAANSASAPTRVASQAVRVVEDDGLPAQTPPPSYIRQLPDDPSEPFSPNYGGTNPASLDAKSKHDAPPPPAVRVPVRVTVPEDLPPSFRRQLVAAVNRDE